MDSVPDILSDGFPHSEILGSKPVCRLPEAYRRLPRLSSPVAAKASTICAYSLDHITPKRRGLWTGSLCQCNIPRLNVLKNAQSIRISQKNTWLSWRLYIHHCPNCKRTICLTTQKTECSRRSSSADFWLRRWWSQPGSNRRPLACKASALPAELWPP